MAALSDLHGIRRIDGVAAASALFAGLARAEAETAGIAYLSRERRLLGMRLIPGRRTSVALPPRMLASDALAFDAHGVIVAHNHPSGDPRPSAGDTAHARRLARALEAIEVRLLDSLILAGDAVTSYRALGLL